MDKFKRMEPREHCCQQEVQEKLSNGTISSDKHDQQSCKSTMSDEAIDDIIFFLPKLLGKELQVTPHVSNPSSTNSTNINFHECANSCDEAKLATERLIKAKVMKMISLSRELMQRGINNVDINGYLKACDDVKKNVEGCRITTGVSHDGTSNCFKCKLNQLKTRINEIVNIAHGIDLKHSRTPIYTPSATSSAANASHKSYESLYDISAFKDDIGKRQKYLDKQLKKIDKVAKYYINDGLLISGVQDFLTSCAIFRSQIAALQEYDKKCMNFENPCTKIQVLAASSTSHKVNEIMDKAAKIEQQVNTNRESSAQSAVNRLVSHIDETLELSESAKTAGLISNSVDNLIRTCANTKDLIKYDPRSEKLKVLRELLHKIEGVIKLINQCKDEGIPTKNLESLLNNLNVAKTKICCHFYKPVNAKPSAEIVIQPSNSTVPDCGCNKSFCSIPELSKHSSKTSVESTCTHCAKSNKPSIKTVYNCCETKPKHTECVTAKPFYPPLCDKTEPKDMSLLQDDGSLGYFETKVRTMTTITRYLNPDGTIREEKEIVTTKSSKHDPNLMEIIDDEDDDVLKSNATIKVASNTSKQGSVKNICKSCQKL